MPLAGMMGMKRDANLFLMICTRHPPRRLTSRLHGRQKHGDQDTDNRNYHEQFDKREARAMFCMHGKFLVHLFAQLLPGGKAQLQMPSQ